MTLDGLGIFFNTVRSYPGVFLVMLILAVVVIGPPLWILLKSIARLISGDR